MIVIHMEQLAHRDWRAGQRPKGGAGFFQGHRHQILSQLGILACPPYVLCDFPSKQYFGLGHPFQPLGSILGPNQTVSLRSIFIPHKISRPGFNRIRIRHISVDQGVAKCAGLSESQVLRLVSRLRHSQTFVKKITPARFQNFDNLPQKYIMPQTLVNVIKTQIMTNTDPTKFEIKQIVAIAIANVARPTFLYNSPLII